MHPGACIKPGSFAPSWQWVWSCAALSLLRETELHRQQDVGLCKILISLMFGMEEVWGMGHCQNNSSLCSTLLVLQSASTEFAPGLWNLMATKAICPLAVPSRFHSLWPPQLLAAMPCQADCYLPGDSSILAWIWIQRFLKLHRLPKFLADELIALHPLQALKIKRCCSMSTEPFFLPLPCFIYCLKYFSSEVRKGFNLFKGVILCWLFHEAMGSYIAL